MGRKLKYAVFAFALLLASVFYLKNFFVSEKNTSVEFNFLATHCSIFDKSGRLVFLFDNYYICDFHSEGYILASSPSEDKLSLYDRENKQVWTANENAHHNVKFTSDGEGFLLITGEVIPYKSALIRSDCFSKRNLKNEIQHQWCISKNLAELNKLGIYILRTIEVSPHIRTKLVNASNELSHANSIYQIPKNTRSESDPTFAEGNFIVNLHTPICAILILDKEMKNILWHKKTCQYVNNSVFSELSTHDIQVTSEGRLLIYLNYLSREKLPSYATLETYADLNSDLPDRFKKTNTNLKPRQTLVPLQLKVDLFNVVSIAKTKSSYLTEIDPYTDKIYWLYSDNPPQNFYSELFGTVTRIGYDRFIYTDITDGNKIIEIDRNGRKIWSLSINMGSKDFKINGAKPLTDTNFLRSRGLIN